MAKPSNKATGTIEVPEADVIAWLQSMILKPPAGTFVAWGKIKLKNGVLEAGYTTSTVEEPSPPSEPSTQPT